MGERSAAICLNTSPAPAQCPQKQVVTEALMFPAKVPESKASSVAATSLGNELGISATSRAASAGTPTSSAMSLQQEEATSGGGNKGAGKDHRVHGSRALSPGSAAPTRGPALHLESPARPPLWRRGLGGAWRGPGGGRSSAASPLLPLLDDAPRVLGMVRSPGRIAGDPILPISEDGSGRSRSPLLRRMGGRIFGAEDLPTDIFE